VLVKAGVAPEKENETDEAAIDIVKEEVAIGIEIEAGIETGTEGETEIVETGTGIAIGVIVIVTEVVIVIVGGIAGHLIVVVEARRGITMRNC